MNDDLSSKLQQLKDMLSDDQMQDKLKSVMSIMPNLPNMQNQNTEENKFNQQSGSNSNNNFNLSENEVMLSKFMKIMDKRKHLNDPRINLLTAIKPYLSQKRQGKIDSYSKIFSFSQLASLFKDDEF